MLLDFEYSCSRVPRSAGGPGSTMKCCDKNPIDTANVVCCDGEIVPKMGPKTYCCNKKPYDPQTQVSQCACCQLLKDKNSMKLLLLASKDQTGKLDIVRNGKNY